MKRIYFGLFVLVLLMVNIITSNPAVFAAKAPVTLKFWFSSADKTTTAYFFNATKNFEKIYPKIKVEATALPSGQAEVDMQLNAAVLRGIYPDVQASMLVNIGTRGSKGEFYPLDKYIAKWRDKKDIYQSVYKIGTYKGKLLGLGFYPNPTVLVCRKDYFQAAGLDPNHPPANWEELAVYAKKLTVREGNRVIRAGMDIPALNSGVFFKTFLRQNGAIMINDNKEKPLLDEPAMISTLEYIMKLRSENVSIPFNYLKKDSIPFVYGKSAMTFMQPAQLTGLFAAHPELKEKIVLAPVLTGKKKSAFCGYRLFTIGKSSIYKKEAWEFIKFMMSKEQMTYRFKELKIPVVRKSLRDDYIADNPAFNKIILDYIEYGQGDNVVPWNSVATDYLQQAYEEAYDGKKTPAQALRDAQVRLIKELKSMQ